MGDLFKAIKRVKRAAGQPEPTDDDLRSKYTGKDREKKRAAARANPQVGLALADIAQEKAAARRRKAIEEEAYELEPADPDVDVVDDPADPDVFDVIEDETEDEIEDEKESADAVYEPEPRVRPGRPSAWSRKS
jgi:hypothetical protein